MSHVPSAVGSRACDIFSCGKDTCHPRVARRPSPRTQENRQVGVRCGHECMQAQRQSDTAVEGTNLGPYFLGRLGIREKSQILVGDHTLIGQKLRVEGPAPELAAHEHDGHGGDLARLYQAQGIEELVHGANATREGHEARFMKCSLRRPK